jgi:hypothetical protein
LNFHVFTVFCPEQITIADAFTGRIDGEALMLVICVVDIVEMVTTAAFVRSGFIVGNLDPPDFETWGQPGRNEADDLELL